MNHFDEMTCMQYLDGQLDRLRAAELTAHADACSECRRLLRALERESELLRGALVEEDEAVPARLLAPPRREPTPWAWIAALGFAAAGAYTLWTGMIQPWQEQLSQAGFGEGNLLAILFFGGVFWKGWGDMQNLVNLLATVSLLGLGLVLVRRSLKRWTTVAMVMSVLVAALVLPAGVSAAEYRHKQTFTLSETEVFHNDLILACGSGKIDGTIEGDLIAFGQSITVNGRVTGDVIVFAESLRITGTVDGNVRAFTSKTDISGTVAKNISLFTQMVEMGSKAEAGGGLLLFAGSSTLDGRVTRDVLALGERFYLNGFIGGNVELRGRELAIGSTAEIQGKTKFTGRKEPEVEKGAKLASPVEFELRKRRPDYLSGRYYWRQALRWGAALVFGLVIMLLFPMFFHEVARSGNRPGASAVAGLVAFFLVPIVAIIACITLVGLAVGLSAILLWALALYASQVFLGTWLGTKLMGETEATGATIGRLAVGLLLIRIAGNIPYVGFWIWLVVFVLGMGALTLTLYKRMRPQPVMTV